MFASVRTALRYARARAATLTEVADGDTAHDIPLMTPVAAPRPPVKDALGIARVGTFPTGIAVSPDGNRVYVVNSGDDSVSVIDAETGTAALTIAVGHAPYGIALTPNGRNAYVANAVGNSVSVIDTQTQTVTATIAVGAKPYGIAVSPECDDVYVTNQADGSLTVIGAVTSTIAVGGAPTGVAVSPDGRHVYVVDNEGHRLVVVDTDAGVVAAAVRVGRQPAQVSVTPDGSRALVTNAGGGTVSVVDLAAARVTETIPVSAHPIGVGMGADGRFAYVTALDHSLLSGTVTIIDTATGMKSTSPAGAPYGVAADPTGDCAYVTNFRSHAVSLIAPAPGAERDARGPEASRRHELVRAIPLDRDIGGVVTDPELSRAFVIRSDDDAIEVVGTSAEPVAVPVGSYPSALVLSRDATRAYVTNYEDDSLSVIDTDPLSELCNTVITTLDVGRCWATGVLLSSDGNRGYAVDERDAHLSVIDTASGSPTRDTVVATVELGEPPAGLRIAPNGRWVYAINHFDHAVWAIHTATNRIAPIRLPTYPYRISLNPNGSRLYVSLCDDGSTCVIDTDPTSSTYHCIIDRIRLGGHVSDPVFTTAGTRAYVVKSDLNAVAVINTGDSSVKHIAVGHYPWDLAVSPAARRAYVANSLDDSVSVISCATDLVTATVPVGARPCRIAVCANGDRAFVVNSADESVSVIDTATATVSATVAVGRAPFDVAVSADGLRAFVEHRGGLSLIAL